MRRAWWFLARPRTRGVKCVVFHDGEVLMIKNSYGHRRWTFPGGRMRRREDPESAVRREVREEVGITLGAVRYLGSYSTSRLHHRDTVHCFATDASSRAYRVDGREVVAAAWFSPVRPPAPHGPSVAAVLRLLGPAHEGPAYEEAGR